MKRDLENFGVLIIEEGPVSEKLVLLKCILMERL